VDGQLIAVFACIAVAGGYLALRTYRTWRRTGKGCGGCGCATPKTAESPLLDLKVRSIRPFSRDPKGNG
jgi:hypothetical protein